MSKLTTALARLQSRLTPRFNAAFIEPAIFQFQFDEGEPFHLVVEKDRFQFVANIDPHPTITLFIDSHTTLAALLTGTLDGMQAFMQGRYRADGNIVLSQLLLHLFRAEDPTVFYRLKD